MKHRVWIVFLFSLVVCVACQHSGKEDMRLRLDYVSRCNRADTVFTEAWLPRVDSLVSYFDRHGNANERMMAHYLQGRVHHDMGEAPSSLQAYYDAIDCADTTNTDCDFKTMKGIYGQMSRIFHQQNLPYDEIWAIQHYIDCIRRTSNMEEYIVAKSQLVRPYFRLGEKDSILQIINDTYQSLKQLGNEHRAASILPVSISIYLERHELQKAKQIMDIFENESGQFDENGNIAKGREHYYYTKGLYCLAVNENKTAEKFFRKAIQYGYLSEGYKGLLSVYREKNVMDSIVRFSRLYEAAQDSLHNKMQTDAIHQMSSLYNYTRHQRIAQENAAKAKKARRERSAILMTAFILLVVGLVFIRRLRHKAKRQYIALSKEYEDTKSKMAVLTDRQRLMAYDHETTMKAKEKELQELLHRIQLADERNAAVSEDRDSLKQVYDELRQEQEEIIRQHADDMEQRDHDVLELREKVMSLESQLLQYSSVDMEAAFRKTRIFQLFNERKSARYVSQCPTDKDWEQLIESFRTHFVRFYTFITIDHHLPVNQYRYCILYRLGFDATEIGVLMNKDKNQRYALRRFIYSSLFGSPVEMERFNEKLKQYF